MRFIVFYNDHPKIKNYTVRIWHLFQTHPNFSGEMTHPAFVKYYKINPRDVSSMGHIFFNQETQSWEIEKSRPPTKIKPERWCEDEQLLVKTVNHFYQHDENMITISLREQELERMYRTTRQFKYNGKNNSY